MVLHKLARLSGIVRWSTSCLKVALLDKPSPQIAAEPLFWPQASLRRSATIWASLVWTPIHIHTDTMESCRCLASKTASSSQNKPTQLHVEVDGLKSRLYNRSSGQAASFKRPRLLGGDPLARARLVEKAALGISDERGEEQDNVSPTSTFTSSN